MSSFTIHDIDEKLDSTLSMEARKRGASKNALVKELLARSLGLDAGRAYADDYGEFSGLWTVAEKAAFDAAQADNSRVDPGDWAP